jgi:hypothetical protein
MHGAHSLVRVAEPFQQLAILLLLDLCLTLAFFFRFPGRDFLGRSRVWWLPAGWCC